MLVFGSRGRWKRRGAGRFHCPTCEQSRSYAQYEFARYGHIFWIPLVPLASGGDYIQCLHCGTQYDTAVLAGEPPPPTPRSPTGTPVGDAVALMLIDDASAEETGRNRRHTLPGSAFETLSHQLAEAGSSLRAQIVSVASGLTSDGRRRLLYYLAAVAVEIEMGEAAMPFLVDAAQSLGLPRAEVDRALQLQLEVATGDPLDTVPTRWLNC